MSNFPINKDDMLAAFADGKIPSAYYWQTLITGMYDTATDVADLEQKHTEVVQYYNYILELSNTIDTHYNQIEIWHGNIDTWQQAVSQNTAITEANKTASETLLEKCQQSEGTVTAGASQATASATAAERYSGNAAQSQIAAERSETNAKTSQEIASSAASNSTQSSIISVEAKETAESAATDAEASKTAAQSSASAASASQAAAKNSETRASNEADRSKLEADRSHNEADRAERAANSITDIPDQTGHGGQFLGTDGTTADWQPIPEGLPPQAGNGGKFLQTDGTTAKWATISDSLPVGSMIPWSGKSAPMGWLVIEPITVYQKADYPALYDHLKKECPHLIIDANTFKLAEGRGAFIRGYDPTGVNDPDGVGRELLTHQGDAIQNFTGRFKPQHGNVGDAFYGFGNNRTEVSGVFGKTSIGNSRVSNATGGAYPGCEINIDASRVVRTAAENRPKNLNALWIIKAYDTIADPELLQAKAVIDQVNSNKSEIDILKNNAFSIQKTVNANGVCYKYPDGTMTQCGRIAFAANIRAWTHILTITFPVVFPAPPQTIIASSIATNASYGWTVHPAALTETNFKVWACDTGVGGNRSGYVDYVSSFRL